MIREKYCLQSHFLYPAIFPTIGYFYRKPPYWRPDLNSWIVTGEHLHSPPEVIRDQSVALFIYRILYLWWWGGEESDPETDPLQIVWVPPLNPASVKINVIALPCIRHHMAPSSPPITQWVFSLPPILKVQQLAWSCGPSDGCGPDLETSVFTISQCKIMQKFWP